MKNTPVICILITLLTAGCFLTSCKTENAPSEESNELAFSTETVDTIRLAGAYALYPLATAWADAFHAAYPNIHFEVSKLSVDEARQMVSDGRADMAMLSQEIQVRKHCWRVAVAKGGVVPVLNAANPYLPKLLEQGVQHDDLIQAYQNGQASWATWTGQGNQDPVKLYYRSDTSGAGITWAQFLWTDITEIKGIPVNGQDEMIQKIKEDVYALGYINMNNCFDLNTRDLQQGLAILPLDLNYNQRIDAKEKLPPTLDEFRRFICLGKYPKNLCRNLYFAAPEEPTAPAIKAFLNYCMNEGQEKLDSMGFGSLKGH